MNYARLVYQTSMIALLCAIISECHPYIPKYGVVYCFCAIFASTKDDKEFLIIGFLLLAMSGFTVANIFISNIGTDYDHFKIRETIGRFAFVGYFVFAVYRYNYKLIDSGLPIDNHGEEDEEEDEEKPAKETDYVENRPNKYQAPEF